MAEKVIVTGGAGFIGSHIVDALVERGFDVHVVDDLSGGKKENVNKKATLHVVDIRDTAALIELFKGASYVFHEAALPRVQRSIQFPQLTNDVNINGTLAVLIAARDNKVKRLIYASTSSAYGGNTVPFTEDMKAEPQSPYGLQKYAAELYVGMFYALYGLPTVSLRYFNIYGPRFSTSDGPYSLVLGKFLDQKKAGTPLTITGDGSHTRDFTHIRDAVRANLLAMESSNVGNGEVINIGAGRNISINKLAEIVGGPTTYIEARVEPPDTKADNSKAKKLLDWEPQVKLEDGIAELKQIFGLI